MWRFVTAADTVSRSVPGRPGLSPVAAFDNLQAMFRGALFDLDGTLVDTLDEIADGLNEALESLGLESHSRDTVQGWVGYGTDKLVERAVPAAKAGLRGELLERVRAAYSESAGRNSHPYRGVSDVLTVLAEAGVELAVLTNKPDEAARQVVEHFFPGRFSHVVGLRLGEPRKPDPSSIMALLRRMRIERSEAVLVGDSEVDVATGKAAGVGVIGVTWGFRSRSELEIVSPEWLIDVPDDIPAIVGVDE
ncbi:MAG: HAD-IA family hydrolase [Acidobacteriota bacterium]|nr:HAD-IA family hydrolase [Acidobacteriota bacterium]